MEKFELITIIVDFSLAAISRPSISKTFSIRSHNLHSNMSALSNILPILLLALPMTIATVDSDYPQPLDYSSQHRAFDSKATSALTIHIIISIVVLVTFILVTITLIKIASRRRRQGPTQLAGKVYNRPGARTTAAPPYRVGDDVYLPAYSYEPARGETVISQSSLVAQPAPAHVSKDVV
ncbi:hypothetical protein NHQ30_002117 [Ciborinia camelliae]|nr:hypothetical protein NHQ30_002117 [Ciborinia camelliae]